jgi:type VI secretion system protein ImpG
MGLSIEHGETYAVRRVLARLVGQRDPVVLPAHTDFDAAADASGFYVARAVARPVGTGTEMELSLGGYVDEEDLADVESLTIDVWATNGGLPVSLGIGDVCVPTSSSPAGLTFRNLCAVTPYRPAAIGNDLRWSALAMMTMSAQSLTSANAIKTLLHAFNLHPATEPQAARAHELRLAAIVDVTATSATLRHREPGVHDGEYALLGGHDVTVQLRAAGFDSEGDALVFGAVLAHLFAHEASLNSFVRTHVRLLETGRTLTMRAMRGDQMLGDMRC